MSRTLGIALYGHNGHQVEHALAANPRAKLIATAAHDAARLPDSLAGSGYSRYETLDQILADEQVDLVSLCSPRRAEQVEHTLACLEAGKHVYAEKPCAMFEEQLDRIIAVAQRTGRRFHEMAGTAFAQPYREMRRLVAEGTIGEVVQVLAQKSYPWQPSRPQDENVDGGITRQVGVHALRMIEHVAGRRIEQIQAIETTRGDPHPNGQLRMASSMMARLEGGALASVVANYLNQKEGFGQWGNETLRIWGTKGFIETTDGGQRTRLIVGERDHGPLDASAPSLDYFDLVVDSILDEKPMPLTLAEELHPTRMVIRASMNAADEDGPR